MATTKTQIKDLFNNAELASNYQVGSLPVSDNTKLGRAAAMVGADLGLGRDATEDEFVVWIYRHVKERVLSYEKQIAINTLSEEEW